MTVTETDTKTEKVDQTQANKKKNLVKISVVLFALLLGGTLTVSAGFNPMQMASWPLGTEETKTQEEAPQVLSSIAETDDEANTADEEEVERQYFQPHDEDLLFDSNGPKEVEIQVDGEELVVETWAMTLEELLTEEEIDIDGDIINLPLEQKIRNGLRVEIIRVVTEFVYEEIPISSQTTYRNDSSLDLGRTVVHTEARDGRKRLTYEVTYNDGVEVSRKLVGEEVISQPVTGVVLRGTRALASRSGGNNVVTGIASWYGAKFHGNRTASGEVYDMNAMTAAHLTLPFGTRVRVTFLETGRSVVVRINDRGPHIAGRILDLSAGAAKEIGLHAHGLGKVRMEILD